jgi:sulfur-oxidizing protein SoxY
MGGSARFDLRRCWQGALGVVLLAAAAGASLADQSVQPPGAMWEFLRAKYYGDKPMGLVDENLVSIEVTGNTPDPAATPLTLRFADDAHIKRARVFIDNNPSPLVASLEFADTPVTEIEMHVRVDRFTSVRVVAERGDGSLEMRSAWVKASGGCSAPPTAAAGGEVGEVRLRPSPDAKSVLVSIRHPNSSGFQIDPRTGENIPAHYISHLRITAGGKTLLDADTGISVSENPTFRVASRVSLPEPLKVEAIDSVTQAHYSAGTQSTSPRTAATDESRMVNGTR